jgi:hypothetical protein
LSFRRPYYLVGEVAQVRERFFAGKLAGSGPLHGGPYYAYLVAGDPFAKIDPAHIAAGAIRLGTVGIEGPVFPKHYAGRYGIATLRFLVPDVPSRVYSIGFCDDPCVHSTIGWLAWGNIRIVHTAYEGRLLTKIGSLEDQTRSLRYRSRQAERRTESLQQSLGTVRAKLARIVASYAASEAQAHHPTPATPAPSGSWPWPLIVGLCALFGALGFAGGIRVASHRGPVPPGPTVPSPEAAEVREPVRV